MRNIDNGVKNGIYNIIRTRPKDYIEEKIQDKPENIEVKNSNLDESPNAIYGRASVNKVDVSSLNKMKKVRQCLLGGAVGDALGRPVERLRSDKMLEYYGKDGIQDLATVGLKARITDDTQLTMYTADGLIKSKINNPDSEEPDYDIIYKSYQDWYKTQTESFKDSKRSGLLNETPDLYSPVGPGRTCLASLKAGIKGTIENPINDSNSCGGVIRVAPVGLMYDNPEVAFKVGAKCAALTHSGPEAYLPAGFFAALISNIAQGKSIYKSAEDSLKILKTYDKNDKTYRLIEKAMYLSQTDAPTAEAIESLGYGFQGDEALAISLYAALKEPNNLKKALILAVNHSGDSDSTGAITGNIVGLANGLSSIPKAWLNSLEMTDLLETLSVDLVNNKKSANLSKKYPIK